MKKLFSLLIALVLAALCLSAVAEPLGEFPIVTEPAELSLWVEQHPSVEDYETNEMTQWYEEKTGVHVNWTQVPSAELGTKFNLSIGGGNYPDIYTCAFATDQVIQYSHAGIFLPLDDLIDQYAPNLKLVLEQRPDIREAITAPDGHIYCLFSTDPATYLLCRDKLFVMTDWLDQYCAVTGKEAPVTTQEFEDMLLYWRDNDMNGNGNAGDEVGVMGSSGATINAAIRYLLSAYQLMPEDGLLADADGSITFAPATDAYREGLKWINHLYEEGLIAEETFIQDGNQLTSVVSREDKAERTVGAFGGFWQGVAASPASMTNAYDVYEALAPLEGPAGVRQSATTGYLPLTLRGAITSACENPEVAMRWLDYWFSEEGMVMIDYGFEGVNWEWNDTPAIDGTTPSRSFLTSRNEMQNVHWQVNTVPYYRTEKSLFGRTPTDHVPYLYAGAKVYEDYETKTGFPQFAWCDDLDILAENNELRTVINDYVLQTQVQFITGAEDIDDDAVWAGYLDSLAGLQLDRYLETVKLINFGA